MDKKAEIWIQCGKIKIKIPETEEHLYAIVKDKPVKKEEPKPLKNKKM